MALFFCSSSRVSNLKSYSWMLLFFFMTVTLSALNAPSLSDYMTIQRRQRRSDQWIAQALNRICPWAECQGWIGCRQTSNPPSPCPTTPRNFVVLEPFEVSGPRRMRLGTCYGYSPPGNPAPFDQCREGPKKDECACISSDRILRIGYSEPGRTQPQDDAPIGDLCASKIASLCYTSTAVPTSELVLTSFVVSTDALSTTTSAPVVLKQVHSSPVVTKQVPSSPATPRLVSSATTYVPTEGSAYLDQWYIWPPVVVVVALALCLLVALYRRRGNFRTTVAEVTSRGRNDVELDEDGYLAVRTVSTTHDNAKSDKNVEAYEDLKSRDPGGYAELRPYQQLKISDGRSAELLPHEEPKANNGGSAELLMYEEPKVSNGGSAELLPSEEPKAKNGGSAERLLYANYRPT